MGQIIRTPLPVFASGTVAGNSGSAVITGTGTGWTTLDANNNSVPAVSPGDVFITPTMAIPIRSVDSATQITLEVALPQTINAGSGYRIIKYQPNLTGGVQSTLAALMAMGTDATPDASRTIDNGAGRLKLRIAANGDPQLAVGPAGTADSALATAVDIAAAGVVGFPKGITTPFLIGRNLLMNGNFAINQRGYASGATLTVYGHDRWRDATLSTSAPGYTFSQADVTTTTSANAIDTTVTLTSGGLLQTIEKGLIAGGTYTLSWIGNAAASIFTIGAGGAYNLVANSSTSPLTVSIPTGSTVAVKFSGANTTLTCAQFEYGAVPTLFERRSNELSLCQRYFYSYAVPGSSDFFFAIVDAQPYRGTVLHLPVTMRTVPTVSFQAATDGTFASNNPYVLQAGVNRIYLRGDTTTTGHATWLLSLTASAEF